MKKLILAITLLCAFFIGCSDSDSSPTSSTKADLARYTVIVYGTSGGAMDSAIENVFERLPPYLKNKDVRVLFNYKYGLKEPIVGNDEENDEPIYGEFTGKYGKPGQLVTFELTKNFDLNTIKKKRIIVNDTVQLYDKGQLSSVLNLAADSLPAEEYILVFYGHGNGFDFDYDYPKEKRQNTALAKVQSTASILLDEWVDDDAMNMYEIKREIEKSSIKHFKAIFFHNCLAGNLESLSETYTLTDYFIASEHELASDGTLIVDFVKELYEDNDFESSVKNFLDNTKNYWKQEYKKIAQNGDLNFIKASEIESFFPIFKNIANRLKTLYKDEKYQRTIAQTFYQSYDVFYSYVAQGNSSFVYDALYLVQTLAKATKDSDLKESAKELEKAFDKLILKKHELHYNADYNIEAFSLSIVIAFREDYKSESIWGYTNKKAYEYTTFHKETGWGDWLNTLSIEPLLPEE